MEALNRDIYICAGSIHSLTLYRDCNRHRRNGHTESNDGLVNAELSVPKAMGGPGKLGTAIPEHLFAAGYAACFGGSLDFVAKQKKKDASTAEVTCAAMIGVREDGGFGLAVKMHVEDKSIGQADLAIFVWEAHETICPDSHATRGNVMSRSRWSAVKDVTTAFEPPCMHGAQQVDGPRFCSRHSDRKGTAGIAAVQSQLGDSKLRPFVSTLWRFNMAKNTEHKKAKDEETLSDQEIRWTIRYLDPGIKDKATDGGIIITLLALFAIVCAAVAVLYRRADCEIESTKSPHAAMASRHDRGSRLQVGQ